MYIYTFAEKLGHKIKTSQLVMHSKISESVTYRDCLS